MKIACISDTHNRHHGIKLPSDIDLLLHAGDFTVSGNQSELIHFNMWLESMPSSQQNVIIPGNHDLLFERNWDYAASLIPSAVILNQEVFEFDGLKIYGEPRQPEFNNWAFNVSRDKMKDVWDKVPKNIDILLTHGPPFGRLDKTEEGDHCGCVYQREWIEENQPMLVVCGHIHEGYGTAKIGQTLIINASICDRSYIPTNKPTIIEI